MRKLTKKEIIVKKTLQFVLGCGVIIGFIVIAGGIGHLEMMDEMHETISRAEEIKSYITSACGPLISILCYWVGWELNIWDD